ncbi:MAG: D-alanyl-D-alanine carboxypeptidase family protein [Ruminococcaceae bacterium]|nr:D-alanyl-D-alanine carboxypeptidase family protein [Oscillospiraceae bacterium]
MSNNQGKTKTLMTCIYATVIAIVALLLVFSVVQIASKVKEKKSGDDNPSGGEGGLVGYEAREVNAAEIYSGYLRLLSDGDETASGLVNISQNRVKKADQNTGFDYYYTVRETGKYHADAQAVTALNDMIKAFYEQNNKNDNIWIWQACDIDSENQDAEYRMGTAFDLYYSEDGKKLPVSRTHATYGWFYTNAYKYGFIVRYPNATEESAESGSVFRYVGVAHAKYITDSKLTLEAYIELIKEKEAGSGLIIGGADGNRYEVYYVASEGDTTEVMLPTSYEYTLGGDGATGFIVTVNRSKRVTNN